MPDDAPWTTRVYHRILELVAPRRAAVARHLERMERDPDYRDATLLAMRVRGYKAARTGPDVTPWTDAGMRSADVEVLHDRHKLTGRSRQAGRDDGLAHGIVHELFPSNVVGDTGIAWQSTTGSESLDDQVEAYWSRRATRRLFPAELQDWVQIQWIICTRLLEDGEVWIKRSHDQATGELFFELVESDRVNTPLDARPADPRGQVRDGVERDSVGRIVAYWVSKWHPGDVHLPFIAGERPKIPGRVAAHYDRLPVDQCYHLRFPGRPGQSRSTPLLTPVMQEVRDLDLLILAVLKRTQVAACLAAFIESDATVEELFDVTAEHYGYQLDQRLVPGMIFRLAPGERISTLAPNYPLREFQEFVVFLCQRIGAAIGVTWQLVLKTFAGANYSSARTDLLESRPTFRRVGAILVGALAWVRREVLLDGVLRGELRAPLAALDDVIWIPRGWQWVDPEKEAKAATIELEAGLCTLRDLAASRGKDWKEILKQRAEEKRLARELGLDEPGAADAAATLAPAADGESEEDDDAADKGRQAA